MQNKKRIQPPKHLLMLRLNQSLMRKVMEMERTYDDRFTIIFEVLEKIVEFKSEEGKTKGEEGEIRMGF